MKDLINIFYKHIIFIVLFITLITSNPTISWGNGAAWNPSATSGIPGPIQQSDLILEREHVIFRIEGPYSKGVANAVFWIKNPTNKLINITMGFPLDYKRMEDKYGKALDSFDFLTTFKVISNGKSINTKLTKNNKYLYPIVYTWDMSFPAKSIVKVEVIYSFTWDYSASDASPTSSESYSFQYITHTGSYWSNTIKEAIFEFHNKNIVDFINNYPSGKYKKWRPDGWGKVESEVSITPKPFDVDYDNSRLIWKRYNWKPHKEKDDILISRSNEETYYLNGCVDNICYGLHSKEDYFSNWCGKDQIADVLKISNVKLNENNWPNILAEFYRYKSDIIESEVNNKKIFNDIMSMPIHIRTEFHLWVLRYLKNYLYAKHGHSFKDPVIKECFAGIIPVHSNFNSTEEYNLKFILTLENKIMPQHKTAWEKVKNNMTIDNGYEFSEETPIK